MTPAPPRTISNPSQEEQSHLVSRRSHTESPKQLFFFSKSNLCICKRCCCSASLQGHWQQCQGILITCKSFLIIHSLFLAPSSYSLIAKSVSSFIRLRSLRGEARQAWTDCSDWTQTGFLWLCSLLQVVYVFTWLNQTDLLRLEYLCFIITVYKFDAMFLETSSVLLDLVLKLSFHGHKKPQKTQKCDSHG